MAVISAMHEGMNPRTITESQMEPALDAAIRTSLCACFPHDREVFAHTRAWHGCLPDWSVVREDGGTVIAHAGVVERTIRVGEEAVRVAGVQNVFVLPDYRGEGLCRLVMTAAMAEAQRRQLDFGLLFCTESLSTIYSNLDWRRLDQRTILRIDADGREGPLPPKNLGMFYPLARHDFPAGTVRLQGNDW